MKVGLYYPSILMGEKPRATAVAEARETKTLWIVRKEDVTIIESNGPVFGAKERRFRKRNGRAVGVDVFVNTWRCSGPVGDAPEGDE